MMDKKYDVFLLFNNKERQIIERINEALRQQEINSWFFDRDVPYGADLQTPEDEALANSECIAVFLGTNGWGPVQKQITQRVLSSGKRVITAVVSTLPDSAFDEFDGLFKNRRWIDFRVWPEDPQPLNDLTKLIRQPVRRRPKLSTDQVINTLVDGSYDAQSRLIDQLRATNGTHDHSEIRSRIIADLKGRFSPQNTSQEWTSARNPKLIVGIRSWMVSALSAVMGEDEYAHSVVLEHLHPAYEPDENVRFWALAGLYYSAFPLSEDQTHPLIEQSGSEKAVRALATIIQAKRNPEIIEHLAGMLSSNEYQNVLPVVYALRVVPIHGLVSKLVSLLDNSFDAPVVYETLCALSHPEIQEEAAKLIEARHDPQQIVEMFLMACDGSNNTTIHRLALLLNKMNLKVIRPLLSQAGSNASPETSQAAARLLKELNTFDADIEIPMFAGSVSDSPVGTDYIDIKRDVATLCSVLISTQVEPPLAIGLFGDWGSGKTFFMNEMQAKVRDLVERSNKPGRVTKFHKRVAQIVFNAWHYSDANLWASMVSHIFEELAKVVSPGETEQEAKIRLLKELQTAKEFKEEAVHARDVAISQRKEKEDDLVELANERTTKEIEISDLRLPDLRELVESDPDLKKALENAMRDLGLPAAISSLESLEAALTEAHTLGGRIRAAFLAVVRSPDKGIVVVLLVLLIGVFPLVAWLLKDVFHSQPFVTYLTALIADIVAVIGTLATSIKEPLKKVTGYLDTFEKAKEKVNQALERKRQQKSGQELTLEKELNAIKAKEHAAIMQLNDADAKVREIENKIREIDEGRSISRFLLERVRSEDYRKHLGIISSIRKDFEHLSNLLPTATENKLTDLESVGRIILYIDDLDRCPTNTVVDVLQAVHLLLAFKIFVVVVGVDSRWLLHSLSRKYSAFQTSNMAAGNGNKANAWSTTPQNYLEKIFQIPFALKPMPKPGFSNLMRHLIPSTVAEESDLGQNSEDVQLNGNPQAQNGAKKVGPDQQLQSAPDSQAKTPKGESHVKKESDADTNKTDQQSSSETLDSRVKVDDEYTDVNPRALDIQKWETEFAEQLNGFITTPRAAKRFANIYRILKASVRPSDLATFEGTRLRPGEFRVVMLLLAILTGLPNPAPAIFAAILKSKADSLCDMFGDEANELEQRGINAADRQKLFDQIELVYPEWSVPGTLEPFSRWAPNVARFSFEASRSLMAI